MSNLQRPTERIGDFNISPRGEKKKIAWHFEVRVGTITLYIDDLLYHQNGSYTDNWNFKATKKEITLGNYGPYLEFTPL